MQMYSGDIVSPIRTRKEGTMRMCLQELLAVMAHVIHCTR